MVAKRRMKKYAVSNLLYLPFSLQLHDYKSTYAHAMANGLLSFIFVLQVVIRSNKVNCFLGGVGSSRC